MPICGTFHGNRVKVRSMTSRLVIKLYNMLVVINKLLSPVNLGLCTNHLSHFKKDAFKKFCSHRQNAADYNLQLQYGQDYSSDGNCWRKFEEAEVTLLSFDCCLFGVEEPSALTCPQTNLSAWSWS